MKLVPIQLSDAYLVLPGYNMVVRADGTVTHVVVGRVHVGAGIAATTTAVSHSGPACMHLCSHVWDFEVIRRKSSSGATAAGALQSPVKDVHPSLAQLPNVL